jgi:hypothetical protein
MIKIRISTIINIKSQIEHLHFLKDADFQEAHINHSFELFLKEQLDYKTVKGDIEIGLKCYLRKKVEKAIQLNTAARSTALLIRGRITAIRYPLIILKSQINNSQLYD